MNNYTIRQDTRISGSLDIQSSVSSSGLYVQAQQLTIGGDIFEHTGSLLVTGSASLLGNSSQTGSIGLSGSIRIINDSTDNPEGSFISASGAGLTNFIVGSQQNGYIQFSNRYGGTQMTYNGLSGFWRFNSSFRLGTGDLYIGEGSVSNPIIRFNGRAQHVIETPYNSSTAPLRITSTDSLIELDTPETYMSGSLTVSGSTKAHRPSNIETTSFTVSDSHKDQFVRISGSGAIIIEIDNTTLSALGEDGEVDFFWENAETTSVTFQASGLVGIISKDSNLDLSAHGSAAHVKRLGATNNVALIGDLA